MLALVYRCLYPIGTLVYLSINVVLSSTRLFSLLNSFLVCLVTYIADLSLVTLRSKMYAYKIGNEETKRAKGINKNYVDKSIHFDDFMKILDSTDDITTYASFNQITRDKSAIYVTRQTKKLFSKENNMIDDKTVFVDKYTSVPIGYKQLSTK